MTDTNTAGLRALQEYLKDCDFCAMTGADPCQPDSDCEAERECAANNPTAQAAPAAGAVAGPEIEFDGYKGHHNVRWYINELNRVRIVNQWLADVYCNKLRDFFTAEYRQHSRNERNAEWMAGNAIADLARGVTKSLDSYWLPGADIPDLAQFERTHDEVTKRLLSGLAAAPTPAAQADSITKERLKEILGKPETVHLNMLNGNIAVITMEQCAHLHGEEMQRKWAAADSVLEDADPIRALIAQHAAILDQNESAYFELCYHRVTGWMAWITDKPLCMPPVINPDRKVLAQGQGETADEACADAARKQGGKHD